MNIFGYNQGISNVEWTFGLNCKSIGNPQLFTKIKSKSKYY